jgi:hypothetical protein
VAGLLFPDFAWAKSCTPPENTAAIKVNLVEGNLAYNTAEPLKMLTRRMRRNEDAGVKSIYSFGLTSVEWRSKADMQLAGMPVGAASYCWYVTEISMTIETHSTIFLAKEIARDSCIWREVMNHEQKHVKLNRILFGRLKDDLKPKIAAVAEGGIETSDGDAAMAVFRPKIEKTIDTVLEKFSAAREKRHRAEIDTEAEYDRVDAACTETEWDAIYRRAGLK